MPTHGGSTFPAATHAAAAATASISAGAGPASFSMRPIVVGGRCAWLLFDVA
eukprot:CAMPEP_0174868858 /NCGR_PEP_ID=MMETSP1114-20130205/66789_1 /TAXON_ID=312471 /ORGANISM="Neobodo designis, Strain CCAP 1951/1" /LENGTH=51 /DNA_ID=CAMNT_0016104087 /DNA_START=1 /DNA_END=156 /DNA_ORIENTATION=-